MVRQRSPTRGDAVRRITLLAVLTPLSLAASVGILRPARRPNARACSRRPRPKRPSRVWFCRIFLRCEFRRP